MEQVCRLVGFFPPNSICTQHYRSNPSIHFCPVCRNSGFDATHTHATEVKGDGVTRNIDYKAKRKDKETSGVHLETDEKTDLRTKQKPTVSNRATTKLIQALYKGAKPSNNAASDCLHCGCAFVIESFFFFSFFFFLPFLNKQSSAFHSSEL